MTYICMLLYTLLPGHHCIIGIAFFNNKDHSDGKKVFIYHYLCVQKSIAFKSNISSKIKGGKASSLHRMEKIGMKTWIIWD